MFSFQGASLRFRANLQFLIASLEKYISRSTLSIAALWSDSTIDWVDYKARFARLVIAQWNLSVEKLQSTIIKKVVGQNGLEPSTSRLSVVCSSQLSYWPISAHFFWWRLAGSNRWPPACKAGALPAELNPHIIFQHLFRYIFLLYPLNWIM